MKEGLPDHARIVSGNQICKFCASLIPIPALQDCKTRHGGSGPHLGPGPRQTEGRRPAAAGGRAGGCRCHRRLAAGRAASPGAWAAQGAAEFSLLRGQMVTAAGPLGTAERMGGGRLEWTRMGTA